MTERPNSAPKENPILIDLKSAPSPLEEVTQELDVSPKYIKKLAEEGAIELWPTNSGKYVSIREIEQFRNAHRSEATLQQS
jgi:hypothetical protein